MNQFATRSGWTLNSPSQGVVELVFVKSVKTADGSTVETKNNCSDDWPIGFVDKPGPQTLTLTVYAQQGKPEADWQRMKELKEYFSMTKQVQNGSRYQFIPGRVTKIDADDDDEGNHTWEVELIFLRVKRM